MIPMSPGFHSGMWWTKTSGISLALRGEAKVGELQKAESQRGRREKTSGETISIHLGACLLFCMQYGRGGQPSNGGQRSIVYVEGAQFQSD